MFYHFLLDDKNFQNEPKYDDKKIQINREILIKNCDFFYSDPTDKILENLSYSFKLGNIYGIKGPSGGGKTTLLNILTGLIKPNNGEIGAKSNRPNNGVL